jgi:hypothetical protein
MLAQMETKNEEEIIVPNNLATFEDPKTGVKTVAFTFKFPDGTNGVVSITRLKRDKWEPSKDIESVHLNWNKAKHYEN